MWKPVNKEKYYLLNEINDLFRNMMQSKNNRGVFNHRRFIARIRAGNSQFNNDEHHDSHEFISWLIDEIHMNIYEDYKNYLRKKLQSKEYKLELQKYLDLKNKSLKVEIDYSKMNAEELDQIILQNIMPTFKTWVQLLFEGQLVSITKCQTCERESQREETFMNLSVDIEENVSLNYCLKKFSKKGLLNLGDKYFCEACNTKQVATR